MSIASVVSRLQTAKTAIATAITTKGGTVTSGDGFEDFATDIASIPSGGGDEYLKVTAVNSSGYPITVDASNMSEIPSRLFASDNTCDAWKYVSQCTLPNDSYTQTCNSRYVFYNNTGLQDVIHPSNQTYIAREFYSNCSGFVNITIPSHITTMYSFSLESCKNLTTVTFAGTPTTIEEYVFSGCTALTTINVPWAEGAVANAPWGATNATINYNYTA